MSKAIGKWLGAATLVAMGTLLFGGGCSQQAEGERCSVLNGNDDCEDGYECAPASDFQGQSNADLCCPPKGQSASTTLCQVRNGQAPFDAAPPPAVDSGSSDASKPDATTQDASTQDATTQDASTQDAATVDAAVADAPTEGG